MSKRRRRSVKDWRPVEEPDLPVDLDAFLSGYLETALWSSHDYDHDESLDQNYSIKDFSEEAVTQAAEDIKGFISDNIDDLVATGASDFRNGVDFWLTRVGHGAGFWDRGYGEVGERLSKAAKIWGSVDPYVGEDGKIYFQ